MDDVRFEGWWNSLPTSQRDHWLRLHPEGPLSAVDVRRLDGTLITKVALDPLGETPAGLVDPPRFKMSAALKDFLDSRR